jgi:hypothetical protein
MPLPSGLVYLINGIVIGYLNSPFDVLIAAYMIKKNSAIFNKMITAKIPIVNKPKYHCRN